AWAGLFATAASAPRRWARRAGELRPALSMRDGLEAWLGLGVTLGVLRRGPQGYRLRGMLSKSLARPESDAAAAFVEEVARLHSHLIIETPARLRQQRRFTLADQQGNLIARSSRLAEPFICEAVDEVIPTRGRIRLLEIGCGSAAYIRYAAARNPELTAVGLELQPDAAALARDNVARWKLTDRVTIEVGDVLQRAPEAVFDVAT